MPPDLASHFTDLLSCVVPKFDDILYAMPSVIKDIKHFNLKATAKYA